MDEHILDAICARLRQKTYIGGSKILYGGCLIEKMVFIVRGKMESIGEDGIVVPLSEGDVCGEELLTWCLEHSSVNKGISSISETHIQILHDKQCSTLSGLTVSFVNFKKQVLVYQFGFCCRWKKNKDSWTEIVEHQVGEVLDKCRSIFPQSC